MIPDDLLPHLVDVIHPGRRTNAYGDVEPDWSPGAVTRVQVWSWLQQQTAAEDHDHRDAQIGDWTWLCNPFTADGQPLTVSGQDRVEWPERGLLLEIAGPPGPAYEPTDLHHYEIRLRAVEG